MHISLRGVGAHQETFIENLKSHTPNGNFHLDIVVMGNSKSSIAIPIFILFSYDSSDGRRKYFSPKTRLRFGF